MKNNSIEPSCELCGQPLQRETSAEGEDSFICVNPKCPAQRMSHIELRLEAIEKLLEISPIVEERIISVPEEVEVPIVMEAEPKSVIEEPIQTLPNLSLEEGKISFHSLIDQLEGSRDKLESLLEQTANEEFLSPQFLHQWAVLMAYSGRTFMAAQRVLMIGGEQELPLLRTIIDRGNSVLPRGRNKLVPSQFYSHLLKWGKEGLSEKTLNMLKSEAGIMTIPIEPEKKLEVIIAPPVPVAREIPPMQPIGLPTEPSIPPPSKNWIERFRPEEGWEFAIGANWLRWVGIGIILSALFLLVVWSASQLKLTTEDIALLAFVGLVLSGVLLHIVSFGLLRFKERSPNISPIGYSLAFLSLGMYYIAMFALRFHPSSPFSGIENEVLYIVLCILLIFISCATAWRHNSSILFIEGYGFVLWLFWHISSQKLVNDLVFSVDMLCVGYIVCILAFLGIAYLRKDTVLTITIQLLTLLLIFLPNSSKIFSTHSVIGEFPDINATIILLFVISITYWIIAFRFPLDISPQFYEIINRYHLSIASVTPVFASFFLLAFRSISGLVFIPYLVVFTTLFLGLAYFQKDLGVAFSLVLLIQLLWLISVGFMDNITFNETIPEINGTLILLLFLTFVFWIIAHKFPSDDTSTRFWDYINRKHLSLAAVGPIFLSFILSRFDFITSDIFVMYLVLFCILWSTNRNFTFDLPDFPIQNISLFDFVTYSSATLFLITLILEPSGNLFSVILGFIAFPLLIIINQNISNMTLQEQEIQEIYTVTNCLFVAIIFLFMSWRDNFSQLGVWISAVLLDRGLDFLEFLGYQYGHNWAFMGYLWIFVVTIISIKIFQTYIIRTLSKFIMVLSSPSVMFVYFGLLGKTSPIHLVFVLVGYIHLIILWFLFTSKIETKDQPICDEHLVFIPGVALLQILGNFLFTTTITNWNIVSTFLVNFLLPFSIGIFMVVRRHFHHLVDSYLVISTSIFTLLQFSYLKSNQQGDAWLLELVFLAFSLFYIYTRIYFGKNQLGSISTSPSILKSLLLTTLYPTLTFSNKEQIGINLLLLCLLGLINNTLCFMFFPTGWSPTAVFLIFDSMVVLPMVFALTLFGIDSRVATVNTLTVYASGLILRLPLLTSYDLDYNIHLLIGLVIQLILHALLIRLSKSTTLITSSITSWTFEFEGRRTWPRDSLRMMAIINPLTFYFYASQLTLRIGGVFKITNIIPMIILSILIAIYFVIETRFTLPSIVSDGGLLFSIFTAWLFTISSLEFIYFTTAATAFLSILYGFWVNRREWRILGISIITISLIYSAIYLAQIPDDLVKIIGFGILGIISVVIAFIYSKFARRFIEEEFQKKNEQEETSTS